MGGGDPGNFPHRIRGAAISAAVSALWIACFILTYTFPRLERTIGAGNTFRLYAAIRALGFIFIWRKFSETKGRTLEQIESQLTGRWCPGRDSNPRPID